MRASRARPEADACGSYAQRCRRDGARRRANANRAAGGQLEALVSVVAANGVRGRRGGTDYFAVRLRVGEDVPRRLRDCHANAWSASLTITRGSIQDAEEHLPGDLVAAPCGSERHRFTGRRAWFSCGLAAPALARRGAGVPRPPGTPARAPLNELGSWRAVRTPLLGTGHSARGDSELRPAVHRSAVKKSSDSVPSCVLAEVTSHLVGLGSPVQLVDAGVV